MKTMAKTFGEFASFGTTQVENLDALDALDRLLAPDADEFDLEFEDRFAQIRRHNRSDGEKGPKLKHPSDPWRKNRRENARRAS